MTRLAPLVLAAALAAGCGGGGEDAQADAPPRLVVLERVALPAKPGGIAVGEGAVWATDPERGHLLRLDPAAGAVARTIDVGDAATVVAAGAGSAWVGDPVRSEIVRVDARSGEVVARVSAGTPSELVYGLGALWAVVSGPAGIVRVDPATNEVTARADVPGAFALAAGAGSVWALERRGRFPGASSELVRIDPDTGEVADRVEVDGIGSGFLAVGPRAAWVTVSSPDNHGIARVDTRTVDVLGLVPMPRTRTTARALGVSAGSVWVVGATRVTRIDTATNSVAESVQVSRYREATPGDPAYADLGPLAVAADGVWVADPASRRVVHVARRR